MTENRIKGDRMLVEDDATAALLLRFLEETGSFRGTATDLLTSLRVMAPVGDLQLLPKGPRALSAHLNRFIIPLERMGIVLERERGSGPERERLWVIRSSRGSPNDLTETVEF
jgi:DNA-binding transcriptional ArsR family regulator